MSSIRVKREGVLLGDPPEREVTGVVDLVGPRGSTTYVLTLSCGHWTACRKPPIKTAAKCVGCLAEVALRERRAAEGDLTDAQLLQLGRSVRGTSNKDCLIRSLVPVALGLHMEPPFEVAYARRRCARLWRDRFSVA